MNILKTALLCAGLNLALTGAVQAGPGVDIDPVVPVVIVSGAVVSSTVASASVFSTGGVLSAAPVALSSAYLLVEEVGSQFDYSDRKPLPLGVVIPADPPPSLD